MDVMYSIGEFSKINRITPKTLRHYEKIGLLLPDRVDDWTGYRYYSTSQLPLINRILMLKELGFSLPEIKDLVKGQSKIQQILKKREGEIQKSIEHEKQRLDRVQEYLVQLEGEKEMRNEVLLKSLPEVLVASMRTRIPDYESYFTVVPKMGEYMESVGAICRDPFYCFTIYHDGEYKENDIDVEICEAVIAPCEESDRVKFKTIKKVDQAACLMHHGPYSTLRKSYNRLFSWIDAEGYEPADHPRESYIDGIWNKESENDWLTEIQIPVVKKEV